MMGRRSYIVLRYLRRISQISFLLFFMFLLIETEYKEDFSKDAPSAIRLTYPVRFFLEIDPLAGLSTAISTHSVYKGLIWSFWLLIGTIIIGRFFCGWICPLGTLNQIASRLKRGHPAAVEVERNRWRSWQNTKYYILVGLMIAAVFSTAVVGLIDPISLITRSFTLSILPGFNYTMRAGVNALKGIPGASSVAGALDAALNRGAIGFRQPYYKLSFLFGTIFLTVLLLNRYITRFWCRGICPLGALLGLASRLSIFGMEKKHERCTNCNLCVLHCQGAAEPQGGVKWLPSECLLCFNCGAVCPEDVVRFKFFPVQESIKQSTDLSRRRLLAGAAFGAIALPLMRSNIGLDVANNPRLIRPPGALEEREFLKRCIRCGECMKVCPNNALHPTLLEAGPEGIWTPMLIPRIGYCEYSCVLCGQVCPTGAIRRIDEDEKLGRKNGKPIRIGTAFYDRGRCLPWAMNIECVVCEEHCPTSPKAIRLRTERVTQDNGEVKTIRRPYVDPNLCIGCGICENKCPVVDKPAIYVTSIGETRSSTNRMLLERTGGGREKRSGGNRTDRGR